MIDERDYKTLKLFRDCPRGYFEEAFLPKEVSRSDLCELIAEKLLERFTLEPYRPETPSTAARCGVRITRSGRQEILLWEKERSDQRWQLLQFVTATLLALAALPVVGDFLALF